jgi:3-phenylpropionate/trans-cinnamate dioxygenase ferredoxin subunit
MALRVRVCHADEIAPGQTRGFDVPGVAVPILIANVDGEYLAASSMCPHEDVSLLGAKRKGTLIICRGHGYRFDLRTGACSHDPTLCLPRYRVVLFDGYVYVDLI